MLVTHYRIDELHSNAYTSGRAMSSLSSNCGSCSLDSIDRGFRVPRSPQIRCQKSMKQMLPTLAPHR